MWAPENIEPCGKTSQSKRHNRTWTSGQNSGQLAGARLCTRPTHVSFSLMSHDASVVMMMVMIVAALVKQKNNNSVAKHTENAAWHFTGAWSSLPAVWKIKCTFHGRTRRSRTRLVLRLYVRSLNISLVVPRTCWDEILLAVDLWDALSNFPPETSLDSERHKQQCYFRSGSKERNQPIWII